MTKWSKRVLIAAAVAAAACIGGGAAAQAPKDNGVPSETQERLRHGGDIDLSWDLIGLLGLLGLLGLRHEPDYHSAI